MTGLPSEVAPRSPGSNFARYRDAAATALAVSFTCLVLLTIPYGAPMPAWYTASLVALGAGLALVLALDARRTYRELTLWPIPLVLGAWGVSIWTCEFPQEVLARSWGMALYSFVCVAAQVACRRRRALKVLVLAVLAVILAIAVDLWCQTVSSRSLIREVRAPELFSIGRPWPDFNLREPFGSLGNKNDHAVVAILLPLCGAVIASPWSWGLLVIGALAGAYEAVTVKSRQLMVGLIVGMATLLGLSVNRRIALWLPAAIVAVLVTVLLANPTSRERIVQIADSPLTGRTIVIAYGLALFSSYPISGIGPSLYGHYYVLGHREGWTFRGQPLIAEGMPWVHCLPVEIACETGILGLIAYGSVLWVFALRLRRAISAGGTARQLGVAVLSASAAMACIGLVDLTFIKDWVRICWWLLLGLGFAAPGLTHDPDHGSMVAR